MFADFCRGFWRHDSFISAFSFHIPFNSLLLPSFVNLCPESLEGWVGRHTGHCPETPMIVSQFSPLASVLRADAPWLWLLRLLCWGKLVPPCSHTKMSWATLVPWWFEINETGYVAEISVLLLSLSHFSLPFLREIWGLPSIASKAEKFPYFWRRLSSGEMLCPQRRKENTEKGGERLFIAHWEEVRGLSVVGSTYPSGGHLRVACTWKACLPGVPQR